MIKITAQNVYDIYSPRKCKRRLYLRSKGVEGAKPEEIEELIRKLGRRHEAEHLESFEEYEDVSKEPHTERAEATKTLIEKKAPVIYQGVLKEKILLDGREVELTGMPDFMIRDGDSYIIRECKIAIRLKEHKEITLQLCIYGFLFRKVTGRAPSRLEAYLGDRTTGDIPYDNQKAVNILKLIKSIKVLDKEPYSPVGWSKCKNCAFRKVCWDRAIKDNNVATLSSVAQNIAIELKDRGVETIEQLLAKYDENSLHDMKLLNMKKPRKIGKAAGRIIKEALARKENRNIVLKKPQLPDSENFVVFDLEGIPPNVDLQQSIYLWGMKVYGKKPGKFIPAIAPIEEDGDRKGWESFLKHVSGIFSEYGDIPFLHWHNYEKTSVKNYIEKYGDPEGTAGRVLDNLCDLFIITKESIVLSVHSYSLKVVEVVAGFKRTQKEFGGAWSIVRYTEAMETKDSKEQEKILSEIIKYNEEDLQATWAVFQWLKIMGTVPIIEPD